MELMFNELSLEPLSNDKYEAIEKAKQFALTFSAGRKKGFKRIRSACHYSEIKLSQDYSIQHFLFDKSLHPRDYKDLKDLLFGNINQPFINEEDEDVENNYILSNFHYNSNGSKQECLGLSAAYLYDVPSISLNSSQEWQNNQLNINIEVEDTTTVHQVYNVFSDNCFSVPIIDQHIENLGNIDLLESKLNPNEKAITLFGDHHGKKHLEALSNKLKNSPYVVEMRSTSFGGNSFIREINSDGVIEVVVMKSDERFALWVQTTGRNNRETKAIAENLRERYS